MEDDRQIATDVAEQMSNSDHRLFSHSLSLMSDYNTKLLWHTQHIPKLYTNGFLCMSFSKPIS